MDVVPHQANSEGSTKLNFSERLTCNQRRSAGIQDSRRRQERNTKRVQSAFLSSTQSSHHVHTPGWTITLPIWQSTHIWNSLRHVFGYKANLRRDRQTRDETHQSGRNRDHHHTRGLQTFLEEGRRIDRNCDVLPLLKFCKNKPILASLLRQFFGGGGKGGVLPQKRV